MNTNERHVLNITIITINNIKRDESRKRKIQ
jgi:hypothetical protein